MDVNHDLMDFKVSGASGCLPAFRDPTVAVVVVPRPRQTCGETDPALWMERGV